MDTKIVTVSTKGQIALPIDIRNQLDISTGDKLVVFTSKDMIMLKVLRLPSAEEFKESMEKAEEWAKSVGYKEEDVNNIVKSVRNRKHV